MNDFIIQFIIDNSILFQTLGSICGIITFYFFLKDRFGTKSSKSESELTNSIKHENLINQEVTFNTIQTKYVDEIISKLIGLLKTKVKPQSQKGGDKCMVKSVPTGVSHKTYKEFPKENIQVEEFTVQIPVSDLKTNTPHNHSYKYPQLHKKSS